MSRQMNKILRAASSRHPDTVRLWARYAAEYRIHEPDYDDGEGGAFFRQADAGISIKLSDIGKQTSISSKYQVMFHESSHMLDWLLNGKNAKQYSELTFPWAKRGEFVQTLWEDAKTLRDGVEKEMKNEWRERFKEIDEAEAYLGKYHRLPLKTIKRMLVAGNIKMGLKDFVGSGHTSVLRAGLLKWRTEIESQEPTPDDVIRTLAHNVHEAVPERGAADLDDMIQAWFPDYNDYAYAGHFREGYWDNRSRPHEAFAEMMSAQIANPESWEHIQRWFPESAKMFQNMVKEALNR